MKKLVITIIACIAIGTFHTQAQSDGVSYLQVIGEQMDAIKADMWDYTSAVAHGKSARKVEKRRKELLTTNAQARARINAMKPFNGSTALRDSCVAFLKLSYSILNDDYSKIVDMEAIAEESYDAMEAYLTAQEMASEKLDKASEMLAGQQKKFAADNNINLVDDKDKTSAKLETAGAVIKYYNMVFLTFFKSNKQELYLISALGSSDLNAVEQNKNALLNSVDEGLKKMDTMKTYKGDATMITVSREVLRFYQTEARDKVPAMLDYFLKKENFEKIKKAMDAKSNKTQVDVDKYNAAVNEMNTAGNQYNAINAELNKKRTALIENWNKTAAAFMDKNTPKYK